MIIKQIFKSNGLFLFLIVVIFYSFYYYTANLAQPQIHFFEDYDSLSGWEMWWDQGQYYKMSTEIINGTFDAADYGYPLGYPLLGVPSLLFGTDNSVFSHHRFFVPDLLLFFGTIYFTLNFTTKLTNNLKISIIALLFLLFFSPYLSWFIQPWNLHILDFGLIGIFYILLKKPEDISNKHIIFIGLLFGWIFATRYVDVLWISPIFLTFIIFNRNKFKYFIPGLLVISLILLSHFVYFGDPLILPNFYQAVFDENSSDRKLYESVGFHKFDWNLQIISDRTYCILFEPLHCLPEKTGDEFVDTWHYYSLFDKIPLFPLSWFLIFSPIGVFSLLKRFNHQQKWILVSILLGFVMSMVYYLADYAFTSGWTVFFRYQMPWLPLFTVFSIIGMHFLYNKIKSLTHSKE